MNNSSATSSSSNSTTTRDSFHQMGQVVFLGILFLFIVLTNLSVIVILKRGGAKKSRMNFFIFHLAIADLTIGFMVVLVDIIIRITLDWHAGIFLCKLVRFFQGVSTFGSTYILVALSLDRVNAIARPLTIPRGATKYWSVTTAWLSASLLSSPLFILSTIKRYEKMAIEQCTINIHGRTNWQIYVTLTAIAVFIIPATIITICYVIIIYVIYNSTNSKARNEVIRLCSYSRTEKSLEGIQKSSKGLYGGVIPKARIKSVKMTFAIVLAFIFCWSPYFVFDLLFVFDLIPEFDGMQALNIFIQSLAPLNSLANPLIYFAFKRRAQNNGLKCCGSQGSFMSQCQNNKLGYCGVPMATQVSEAGLSKQNEEFIQMRSLDKGDSFELANQIIERRHLPTTYVKNNLSEVEVPLQQVVIIEEKI